MKRTVLTFTLTLLLMATVCISATAQGTWTLDTEFQLPLFYTPKSVEFVNNSTVIIGVERSKTRGRLYKWNFNTGSSRYVGINVGVDELAISNDKSYFMYSKTNGSVGSRYTSDLSWRSGFSTGFIENFGAQLAFADVRSGYEHLVVGGANQSRQAQYQVWKVASTPFKRLKVRTISNRVIIQDLETGKQVNKFFVADGDTNADLFDTNGSWVTDYGHPNSGEAIFSLAFNWQTDADRLATGKVHDDGIRIYRYSDQEHLRTVSMGLGEGILHTVSALDFSPTHWDILACGSISGRVVVWDINGGGSILDHGGFFLSVWDVAFSPNGRYIASAHDNTVKIWRNTGGLAAPSANPEPEKSPEVTTLLPNFPNPFNPETWIPYQLATPAEVTVSIHSAAGKLVRTLAFGQMPAGVYQDKARAAYWDGKNEQGEPVASGVYFYTLKAGEFSATKKMLIRK